MLFPVHRAIPARSLAARLYTYAFLADLVLLYPVYALLFADTGLTTAQISSLFVVWAVTGLLVEVPSGVWADVVSRRLLLVLAPVPAAAGFGLWVLVPSYPAFAVGFALWGIGGALQSGALESLVYTELDRSGATSRYVGIMGRAAAAGTLAVAAATALAAPVLAAGGYRAVGVASVVAGLACAAVAATFPEGRDAVVDGADPRQTTGFSAYADVLRSGATEVTARAPVRAAVLLVPVVAAPWGALEEYTPLLAAGTVTAVAAVPALLLLLSAGTAVGGLLGGRLPRPSATGMAGLLALGAVAMAVGALARHPAGFVALAVALGAFQLATVVADARLQQTITGPGRATVTSVAGLGTDLATIGVYGLYAGGSLVADHATLFALASAGYLGIALVLAALVARRRRRISRGRSGG